MKLVRRVASGLGVLALLSAVVVLTLWIFRVPVGPGLALLAEGAFGDAFAWSRTAVKATPLLLTGLGMIVAWRAGMYNIGGEGQFLLGGLFAATLAMPLIGSGGASGALGVVGMLLVSILGGALWAALAGWLFVRRGVDVVISTILLNFVAMQLLAWAVGGPLRAEAGGVPMTAPLPDALMLPRWSRQMDLHAGVLLALGASLAMSIYLFGTRAGFRLRVVGQSERVARANRIPAGWTRIQAMLVSGGLCGLAGGIEYLGMARQLGEGFSQNWGFLGIPVALLSGLEPMMAIPSALFFGALFAASDNLARFTSAGPTLVYIVQAAAVLGFVGARAVAQRRLRHGPATPSSEPDRT